MAKSKVLALSAILCTLATGIMAAPAIVMDVQSGRVIAAEQAFDRWSPASLTKLMTAYVTFREIEAGNLTPLSPVRMSSNAANNPPSKMGYKPGAVMTVENALEMLIVKSANDVAVALGEAVSGSESEFVARMNAEAKRLGMNDTNFVNPNGLHDPNQYTTARDLVILAAAIRKNYPQYDPIFAAEAIRIGDKVTATYNLLLGRYAGADGMKTGFVCASGFNLAASATRQGRTVVAIVLGATSQKTRAEKSVSLLEKAFGSAPQAGTAITELSRPADASNQLANMRPTVCTEQARAQRWDGRQIEGYINFETQLITALNRPPNALQSGLGGADGVSKSAVMLNGKFVKAYPIPTAKPYRPTLLEAGDAKRYGLRPGFDVPIPNLRPQSG
ncbi:MAG: D-alanyl-D-alanine carboxypeptidase family protein [Pseudomonadota bacterium]